MTNTHIPYVIKTNGAITMYLNRESATVEVDHPNYSKVVDALKTGQFDLIDKLVNISKSIISYTSTNKGKVKIDNGIVTYDNIPLHSTLTIRIVKMMSEGFKFDHMVKFLENLLNNPSKRAVEELYAFLENRGLPITDDGCFLAYKAVNNNYMDIHTGTIRNQVGDVPYMLRNLVDDDFGKDCSSGLHVGALDYVTQYGHFVKGQIPVVGGNRLLIVKVNPADVVSVPKYENFPKMRVCKYQVIDEIKDVVKELENVVYKSDGSELTPDIEDIYDDAGDYTENDQPKKWDGVVDTTSPFNADSYSEGYAVGITDFDNGEDYGWSRDYSRENSYRIGYNDAYNERPNQLDTEPDDDKCHESSRNGDCTCESDQNFKDGEYTYGYTIGQRDAELRSDFEFSLDADDSEFFVNGYRDGYNDYFNI